MVLNQALLDRRGPLQFGSLVAVLPREGKRLKIVRLNLETERKENIVGRARKRVEKKCLSVRATAAMRVLAEALNSSGEIRALKLYKSIFVDNLPFLKFCSVL